MNISEKTEKIEENWDNDDYSTYVPCVEDKDIIRSPPIGKGKRERRRFRMEERIRHSRIENLLTQREQNTWADNVLNNKNRFCDKKFDSDK